PQASLRRELMLLKEELSRKEVEVSRFRDMLSIRMVDRVLFGSGKVDITPQGRRTLRKVAGLLRELKGKKILVEGHTDNLPPSRELKQRFPSNWELSTARASAVARYLQRFDIEPERFVALGYGPYRPLAPNDTEEGRALNRRIEIVVTHLPLRPGEISP
ncbi:MAG: flagellar motor protein MotB, partial [Nitrospinota bacterium]